MPVKVSLQCGYLFRYNFPILASIQGRAGRYQHKSFLNLLLIRLCAGALLVWFEICLCCVLSVGAGELVCYSAYPGSVCQQGCTSTTATWIHALVIHSAVYCSGAVLRWWVGNCAALSWVCICPRSYTGCLLCSDTHLCLRDLLKSTPLVSFCAPL